jgi:ribosomal protein S18 acetylase RimI-like enzyme
MLPYTFRHVEPQYDLPKLARLLAEVEAADREDRDTSQTKLREQLSLPGHDPAQDSWAVEAVDDPERLVAFAGVWKAPDSDRADIMGVVNPDVRHKGIGRILIGRVLTRARVLGVRQVDAYADARNEAGMAFLHEHNFLPVAAYTRLRARRGAQVSPPSYPPGFTVKSFDRVLDVSILAEAMNGGYDGLWGHQRVTEAELGSMLKEYPQEGIFLVFDAGNEVAGVCRAEISQRLTAQRGEPTGLVDSPGVIPFRRRDGLYLPLLLSAMRYVAAQNPGAIELESWGDDDRVLASYEKAGFAVARRSMAHRLNLR